MKIYVLFFVGKAAFSNYTQTGHIRATLHTLTIHLRLGILPYFLSPPSSLPPPLPVLLFLFLFFIQ